MKSLGRGRIVLWEGASLWAFDVPRAPSARHSTDAHAHHALQLTISVGGDFAFQVGSETIDGPAVLIAPDVPHVYSSQGRNLILLIEPESRQGAALLRGLAGRPYLRPDVDALGDLSAALTCTWEEPRPDDATLIRMGRAVVARLADTGVAARVAVPDVRILRVLERLGSDPDLRMTASEAAGIACLSDSRFSHLFVERVGLPFRTYVLWRRLAIAVDRMAAGTSLTSAAHEAGFADSAHFSRTFLRMFGIPASVLTMI
jgi:AraC family transcriptional regulator